jgi:hypothetical protein
MTKKIEEIKKETKGIEIKEEKKTRTTKGTKTIEKTEPKTITIKIGHIGTGKSQIISFYDKKKGKQITTLFPINPYTMNDRGEQDGYYNYGHHLDLREGRHIEQLKTKFPNLKTLKEMREEDGMKGLMETSYTEIMIYELHKLIKEGHFNTSGINKDKEYILINFEWTGEDLQNPQPRLEKEKTPREKKPKEELLQGISFFN